MGAQLNVGRRRASKRVTDRYEGLSRSNADHFRKAQAAQHVEHRARHNSNLDANRASIEGLTGNSSPFS
jgi:hypothetical protein